MASGRVLFGGLIDGLPSGGDVLSRACRGVAGAQERHDGHKREHSQSEDDLQARSAQPLSCSRSAGIPSRGWQDT